MVSVKVTGGNPEVTAVMVTGPGVEPRVTMTEATPFPVVDTHATNSPRFYRVQKN